MAAEVNPPVINRQAEDPEMQQWAFEALAALEAGKVAGRMCLERHKEAGEALIKAKRKCGYGKWLSWLRTNKIDRFDAARSMRAAKCAELHIWKNGVKVLTDDGEEQEKLDPSVQVQKQFCSRDCRLGVGPAKCKACAKLNKVVWTDEEPPPPKTDVPDAPAAKPVVPSPKLGKILAQAEVYGKLAKRTRQLSKRIRQVERSDIYRMITGSKAEKLADALLNVSTVLVKAEPKEPCPDCGGASVNASEDSVPCKGCNGKGVLTLAQVEARKERLNF